MRISRVHVRVHTTVDAGVLCVHVQLGELLLSTEDTVAVLLLCSRRCICVAFFQPIWQRSPCDVLHRVPQPVVSYRTCAIHTARCIWGQFHCILLSVDIYCVLWSAVENVVLRSVQYMACVNIANASIVPTFLWSSDIRCIYISATYTADMYIYFFVTACDVLLFFFCK